MKENKERETVERLKDLIVQATKERSHYYVRYACVEAIKEIESLENENAQLRYQVMALSKMAIERGE